MAGTLRLDPGLLYWIRLRHSSGRVCDATQAYPVLAPLFLWRSDLPARYMLEENSYPA